MNPFAQIPFSRYVTPLILGILIQLFFSLPHSYSLYLLFCSFCGVLVFAYSKTIRAKYQLRYFFAILLQLLWLSMGMFFTAINDTSQKSNYFFLPKNHPQYIAVKLKEPPSKKRKSYKALAEVFAVYDGIRMKSCQGNLLLYFIEDSIAIQQLYCGYELLICSDAITIAAPKNPGCFNFQRYLAFQNIYHQSYVKPNEWLILKKANTTEMMYLVYKTRDKLLSVLGRFVDTKTERGVAGALLFGYKDELDQDVVNAYARTGTLHVLAVSGMHVAILYVVVSFLFKPFQKKKIGAWLVAIITIFLIWFYSLISGMSPSIVRASVMFTIIVLGKALRDDISIYNNLFTSSCMILCYDPFFLFDAGFQLSYLAVLGIVYFQPKIHSFLIVDSWLGRQIWSLVSVSVAAQIATVPISLFYFSQFPNFFIFSNLIIIPITTIIMYAGIVLMVFGGIQWIGEVLGFFINKMILFADTIILKIQALPFAVTEGLYITMPETVFWYVFIALLLVFIETGRTRYIKFAFYGFLGMFIFLGVKKYQQQQQSFAVLNAVAGSFSLNLIEGNESVLICDSIASNSTQKIKNTFQGFWNAKGVEKLTFLNARDRLVSNHFICDSTRLITKSSTVFFVDEKTNLELSSSVKLTHLVLRNNCDVSLSALMEHYNFDLLVFDGSLKFWNKKKYKLEVKKLQLRSHDVIEDGALFID